MVVAIFFNFAFTKICGVNPLKIVFTLLNSIVFFIVFEIKEILKFPVFWLRAALLIWFIKIISERIFRYVCCDFSYKIELEFILNSSKDHPDKLMIGLVIFSSIFLFTMLIIQIISIILRVCLNKFKLTITTKSTKHIFSKIIHLLQRDGYVKIENNKIIKNATSEKLKNIFKHGAVTNYSILNQSASFVTIAYLPIAFFNIYTIFISAFLIIIYLYFIFYIDAYISQVHKLNQIL